MQWKFVPLGRTIQQADFVKNIDAWTSIVNGDGDEDEEECLYFFFRKRQIILQIASVLMTKKLTIRQVQNFPFEKSFLFRSLPGGRRKSRELSLEPLDSSGQTRL